MLTNSTHGGTLRHRGGVPRGGQTMNATRIPEDEQRFAISRVAEICGTTPSTLRSWERRYGFPAPPRRGSGHRVYTREEVELIREVVARTQRGVAVSLAIEDVRQQASAATKIAPLKPVELVSRFVDAVQALDIASARAIFRQAWEMLDWDTLAREFIMPAMREIGDRWHAGQLSVAAEHMASSLVRTHVLSVIRFLGDQQDGPEAICGVVAGRSCTWAPRYRSRSSPARWSSRSRTRCSSRRQRSTRLVPCAACPRRCASATSPTRASSSAAARRNYMSCLVICRRCGS